MFDIDFFYGKISLGDIMTLKQLEYVIKVAEKLNISEAANELFIAQPSLTHAIHELEEEMNIQIFIRTNKGVSITSDGEVFLGYARQVLDEANLLEERFKNIKSKPKFAISCQHYSFCVSAFSDCINEFNSNEYDFTLRETTTYEIINDVNNLKSELGVLYLSNKNKDVILNILKKNDLIFTTLFEAEPHVFISKNNPLAKNNIIELKDLEPYPYLTYEQGNYNSFYFAEEFLPTIYSNKNIIVKDRATLFNLVDKLNGYTVSSGKMFKDVNEDIIIAKKFKYEEKMNIGYITKKGISLSKYANAFINYIKNYVN